MSRPVRPMRWVKSSLLLLGLALGTSLSGLSCAHPSAVAAAPRVAARELEKLERDFQLFVSARLDNTGDVDTQTAALERLRLRYVDLLPRVSTPREHVMCLVRLAELHLDLAARVRRVPYPNHLPTTERASFDDTLSQLALPLEALGDGLLTQALSFAHKRHVRGRFVQRAEVYRTLMHNEPLSHSELMWLKAELTETHFQAPRRLLDRGRIGQRAARLNTSASPFPMSR